VLIGASTDDVLAMISTGILLDPRLRFDPDSVNKHYLTPPLPTFGKRLETWFEDEITSRPTRVSPVALAIEPTRSEVRSPSSPFLLAMPAAAVKDVIFRNSVELERFRDNLLTLGLETKLGQTQVRVDSDKFGAPTTDSRTELLDLSLDERLKVQRVFRVTSAMAVSIAARRDRRTTDHAVRLLKGLPTKSPAHERDGDTPLFDGILSHRSGSSTLPRDSIQRIVVEWSNVIMCDDYSNPMSIGSLLEKLESALKRNASLEGHIEQVTIRFTELRNLVDGTRAMGPFAPTTDTPAITRVLNALQLMVMRRLPIDLLSMPRKDHQATPGVFMLAAYWCGLSTPRTNLQREVVAEPLLSVLVDLEVEAMNSGESTLSVVSRKFLVETDSSTERRVFDFTINGVAAGPPIGSTWKEESLPPKGEWPGEGKPSVQESRQILAEYPLSGVDVEIRDGIVRIVAKSPAPPSRGTQGTGKPKPLWKDQS
jgi:hypothetical protein